MPQYADRSIAVVHSQTVRTARSPRWITPERMGTASRFIRTMFERDNTPIWLGGLVAAAALALVASYSQIRTVDQTDLAAAARAGAAAPPLSAAEIQEISNIAPAAGQD